MHATLPFVHLLFHLGSAPALSLAELMAAVPGFSPAHIGRGWCVAEVASVPNIDALGGTVRIADVGDAATVSTSELENTIVRLLTAQRHEGRVEFGITVLEGELALRQLGMRIKDAVQALGPKARFVSSGHREMVTVVVRTKKVTEIVVAKVAGRWVVGVTVAVQDPNAYTLRDTVKPARNLQRGMLPPKLAQMLLNLASPPPGSTILDPFCGTGTVLLEAIVQGRHRTGQIRGSDIDPVAVAESQRNLAWYSIIRSQAFPPEWVTQADAAQLPDMDNLGAIATEGTLGPLLSAVPNAAQLDDTWEELSRIYKPFFSWAGRMLLPGARLLLTLPVFHIGTKREEFPKQRFDRLLPAMLSLVPLLTADLAKQAGGALTARGGIVADRPDQFVGREVVMLRRTPKVS